MLPVWAGEICQVEGTDGLYIFNEPINRATTYVGELRQGAKPEVVGISSNTWSKIIYKGDTCYVKTRYLVPGDEETLAKTPEWQHPGKRKNTYASINWYFSTDRIMEALPDFRILHDKLPFNTDYCLIIAVILLVIASISLFFMEDSLSFGDTNYWILYALAIIISSWLNWAVLALAALPLLSMLYRAIVSRRISPLFVLAPFYIVQDWLRILGKWK